MFTFEVLNNKQLSTVYNDSIQKTFVLFTIFVTYIESGPACAYGPSVFETKEKPVAVDLKTPKEMQRRKNVEYKIKIKSSTNGRF